ncbi:DUF3558 domain-containing protein [Rhodococcus sp. P1Y]|uniref:DUF3558 domain-containing protein n=1 Tax=Rhodococcus sp. P1Y TaxID=1302308 RepID=UPI000EABABDA|nr:DUF3558 domain-containing protein [Rhodococcus sp. P1Y]AYJ50707.1 DUF3558 domain-containing protein [Rhodococcus sp. P1Y]
MRSVGFTTVWKRRTYLGLIAVAVLAAGCSGSEPESSGSSSDPTTPAQPSTEELFVGECGSMTDERLTSITGISGLTTSSANAVRCRWDAVDTGAYAMFTWYRGSPIDRERTVAGQMGREIGIIDADGHPGFTAKGSDTSCEAGVESGDGFLHWSLNYYYAAPPRPSCDVVEDLIRATVENAK